MIKFKKLKSVFFCFCYCCCLSSNKINKKTHIFDIKIWIKKLLPKKKKRRTWFLVFGVLEILFLVFIYFFLYFTQFNGFWYLFDQTEEDMIDWELTYRLIQLIRIVRCLTFLVWKNDDMFAHTLLVHDFLLRLGSTRYEVEVFRIVCNNLNVKIIMFKSE